MYFNSRADSRFHRRHSNYNSKFNPQHRRRFRSPSPPVRKYRNRESSDLKRSSRVSSVPSQDNVVRVWFEFLLQCYQSSRCIGVFGMSPETTQETLYNVFRKFGPIERIQMVNFTQVSELKRCFPKLYFFWYKHYTADVCLAWILFYLLRESLRCLHS